MRFIKFLIIVVLSGKTLVTLAGGIEGYVKTQGKEPIEFATIYVKELGTGTTTNIEGYFKISLEAGAYHLVFQHLGFKAKEVTVQVKTGFESLNINLEEETIMLRTVVVSSADEDPAYSIMRKAIAKARYHTQQLNSFEAEVYIKGSGRLLDSPFFLRKMVEKEGVDSTTSFAIESVSRIKYTRPDTYEEEVISVRSSGDANGTSPNSFIFGSFYDPKYVDAISPLSPKAFAYYKFEYLGTKKERGYEISKIKVTPRSMGDDIFWGQISIVEDDWSIQSTNLNMQKIGILFNVKQIYEPIEPHVWLPISHQFEVTGKVFGFSFEYNYLSTIGKYKIEVNPDLAQEFEIVDENKEEEQAKKLQSSPKDSLETKLAEGGELTRKQFRKLINEYEKEEKKEQDEPLVVGNYTYKVDSLAATTDSVYWAAIRPVPLTEYEKKGYYKMDSVALAEKKEAEGDTLDEKNHSGFKPLDVLTGYTFRWGENDRLTYYGPAGLFFFNTVEGFNIGLKFKYVHTFKDKTKLFVWSEGKYGFSSEQFYGKVATEYRYGPLYKRSSMRLGGGVFTNQLNIDRPITPIVNTLTSLFWKDNFMKYYQASFLSIENKGYFSDRLSYTLGFTYENRTPLFNTTDYTWSKKSEGYSDNAPVNIELPSTEFNEHNAYLLNLGLEYRPWLKFNIRNGTKHVISSSSPTFSISYKTGLQLASSADADFGKLNLGFKHSFKPGIRGQFFVDVNSGAFVGNKPQYFIDYNHFAGNESPFLMEDPVGSYRLLPYYYYSTADKYASAQVLYQFRKFLFTQIPALRLTGVKELAYVSYLVTPNSGNYVEMGYGLDNLFRFMRVEVSTSFIDGAYNSFGVKIGLATGITTGDGQINIRF
ncbi:MAG: carboxypeptidase-like regulatory domain-containing protein [Cyclobacteriaceae bacterium]|nr:carboxypeptidase-like regulatory domain-containing protein [Cyclobacteriaceae bacterium]